MKLRLFGKIYFSIISCIELTLAILFLVLPFYSVTTLDLFIGYTTFFGWLLAALSIFIAVTFLFLFLSTFAFHSERMASFFNSEWNVRIISFVGFFLIYLQIVGLAITQIYYAIFDIENPYYVLLIVILSVLLPAFLYFIANFEESPSRIYALSRDAPLRIKLLAIWLIFLTGTMQILSVQWEILIIGLLLLVAAYLFFFLNRSAIAVVPSILLIHVLFSIITSVISFLYIDEFLVILATNGLITTKPIAYLFSVMILIIPGLISLILGQSILRKWVFGWIKNVQPDIEMEIHLELDE
ncbi:MAG: hypothetical protein FK734_00425 [Asgard group archaeon]|nr:hypothetical protein [Asgard group archaeon]